MLQRISHQQEQLHLLKSPTGHQGLKIGQKRCKAFGPSLKTKHQPIRHWNRIVCSCDESTPPAALLLLAAVNPAMAIPSASSEIEPRLVRGRSATSRPTLRPTLRPRLPAPAQPTYVTG